MQGARFKPCAAWVLVAAAAIVGPLRAAEPPLPVYVPVELPANLAATLADRLATRASYDAKDQQAFWEALLPEQRQAVVWQLLAEDPRDTLQDVSLLIRRGPHEANAEMVPVLLAALDDAQSFETRFRAYTLAGSMGFNEQGPYAMDPKMVILLDLLVTKALRAEGDAERGAALEAIAQFHAHPAPWVHRIATLLDHASPAVRRQAARTLSHTGPIAVVYIDTMLRQYNMNDRSEARAAAWVMAEIGWTPDGVGPSLVAHIRAADDPGSVSPFNYPIGRLPASKDMADALLTLAPPQLCHHEICSWIETHAAGDRRFIDPLLAALRHDWTPSEIGREASCFDTPVLLRALVAVGRGDKNLSAALTAMLDEPIPVDARLYLGRALTELTGDPNFHAENLVWVLARDQQRTSTYTDQRVLELVGEVDPAKQVLLEPYEQAIAALVQETSQGDPTGHFVFTGELDAVLEWARGDLESTFQKSPISSWLDDGVSERLGPLAEPLSAQLADLLHHGDRWDHHGACSAIFSLGPNPVTRELAAEMPALAKKFKPDRRIEPALAMWACARDIDGALAILVPLLDDQGWATTHASWALGQMGRDAQAALPRLRKLAQSSNPAYATYADEAVRLIEAELTRKDDMDAIWNELGDDDARVAMRAMWRLSDLGDPVALSLEDRVVQDFAPRLPGKRMRHHARAAQVLAIIESR